MKRRDDAPNLIDTSKSLYPTSLIQPTERITSSKCKGKSLEQIDRMFQHGVPLRKFGSHKGDEDSQAVESVDQSVLKDLAAFHVERVESA